MRIRLTPAWPPLDDAQRTCAADEVVEPLKSHDVTNAEVVDRRAFLHIGTMEVDLAAVRETDDAVPLTNEQLHNPAGIRHTSAFRRSQQLFSALPWGIPHLAVDVLVCHVWFARRGRMWLPRCAPFLPARFRATTL